MINVGVLDLQGSVLEHIKSLEKIHGVNPVKVKYKDDLEKIDGIILPGGESTTINKLLNDFGLFDLLKSKIESGLPVWGTCAGMILLAKKIEGQLNNCLGVMDIKVKRNAYGGQLDSFCTKEVIKEVSKNPIDLVFIRAPYVVDIGDNVTIIKKLNNNIVAVKQNNMLATSFHPELTDDLTFHKYFINNFIKKV